MKLRALPVWSRRGLRHQTLMQVGLIFGFWGAGQGLAHLSGLPIPGALIGLVLLLLALSSGRLSHLSARRGAQCFLADMLLFFVPAVLAVTDHPEFLGWLGLKLLVVVLGGTLVVMVATALTVEWCYRWLTARAARPRPGVPRQPLRRVASQAPVEGRS